MAGQFAGKVALVTGGSSGIGRSVRPSLCQRRCSALLFLTGKAERGKDG